MEHKSDSDTNCNWHTWNSHQSSGTGTGGLENKRTSGDNSNYGVDEIGQNTKKSPGELRKLVVSPISVENYQLLLVWRTFENLLCFCCNNIVIYVTLESLLFFVVLKNKLHKSDNLTQTPRIFCFGDLLWIDIELDEKTWINLTRL